jgi:cytochrome c oxidase subunit 2
MNLFELFDYMPAQGAEWAIKIDWINNWISIVSVLCTVAIVGVMLYFGIKYRRKTDNDVTSNISHNTTIEVVWTVIPTLVCIYVFAYGFFIYKDMREPPANAMEVQVVGWKWAWQFTYPNGKKSNELTVPIGKPVRLIMTSKDVIHSFFLPTMRVKEDVYKGNYSYLWFTPTKLGTSHVFCAEYCGTLHSKMTTSLHVVSEQEFQDFLIDRTEGEKVELSPAEAGKLVFEKTACNSCHSLGEQRLIGPGLGGLLAGNKKREFEDGTDLISDENYVRESILNSKAKIVKGFAPVMPPYEGQLSDEEIAQLIAYLKTL